MAIATTNPATGQIVRTFNPHSEGEIEKRLHAAATAAGEWRRGPAGERMALLEAAATILETERDSLARLMTLEMGKTIRAAGDEVDKCARTCRWYAENAAKLLEPREMPDEHDGTTIRFEPLGVVLAVMPWNFPLWQVIRFAAPALAAGNSVLLKHASNVPQCALALEDLFRRAGAGEGVFQALLIGSARVARVIEDPRVAAVTLTGSTSAGRAIAAEAGANIKKTVLELGGSDPFIVMPSAQLELAVEKAVAGRVINNGQSCIASKRFIVHSDIADRFMESFVEGMKSLRVGDPMDAETDVGPLATRSILNDLEEQVEETLAMGGRLLCGGRRLDGPGNYYAPTVIADVPMASPAQREELFGPAAAVFIVGSVEEAIRVANDSQFGLGASVWTSDRSEASRFAREIEAGSVFVNQLVASDARFPFGGIKLSGYGRELGEDGLMSS
jgi:succinate-semialdehyde dehydrogenase / glutarate-semialdehyde dehydrogenase